MKVLNNINLIDLAVYTQNTLIITDTHIGYEEAMNKQGTFMPRFQFKELIQRLENIFKKLKSKKILTVVIAGDVTHEFGILSDQAWRHTLKTIDFFLKKNLNVVLIKGNHDTLLDKIAEKRNVTLCDQFLIKDNEQYTIKRKTKTLLTKTKIRTKQPILVTHGDIIPHKDIVKEAKTIMIGHQHPCIAIRDNNRVEKFKCFLISTWQRKDIIAMPSFHFVTEGFDFLIEGVNTPFLEKNIMKSKVIIVADKLYNFGTVKDVAKLNC